MERFRDFRDVLTDLIGRRIRLCFFIDSPEGGRRYTQMGRIDEVNEHTLAMTPEVAADDPPLERCLFNLGAIVVFGVDVIPDDYEFPEADEEPSHVGERTEYIPYDKEGKPTREPKEGYVVLHKDHIYAKGTVYTKVPNKEKKEDE